MVLLLAVFPLNLDLWPGISTSEFSTDESPEGDAYRLVSSALCETSTIGLIAFAGRSRIPSYETDSPWLAS